MGPLHRPFATVVALAISIAAFTGCTIEERPVRVRGPVMVEAAPPPERAEVQPPPPGPRFTWVRGHWHWNSHEWLWIPGHWDAARPGYEYVHGHWERRGPHWVWIDGYWRRN